MFTRELRMRAAGIDILSTFLRAEETPVGYQQDMLRHWNEQRDERFAPTLREFGLASCPPNVLPRMSITDISGAEPFGSRYRYWGTALTEVYGGDFTGKTPADVPPKGVGMRMEGGCARLFNERTPHCEVKEYLTHAGYLGRAVILRLPLSDDGETVNHGANIYYFESANSSQPLTDFYDQVFSHIGKE